MKSNTPQLVQQFIDALHALEKGEEAQADEVAQLFSDDAHLTNAALQLAGDAREGRDSIARFWREYKETLGEAFSEFHQITTGENAAGLFWTTKGKSPEGKEIAYDGATLLEFGEDGKIARFQGYYDTRELQL